MTRCYRAVMVVTSAYSPIDPVVQANPYPFYEELRRGPAATYLPQDDLWVIPGFGDVWSIVRSPDDFSSKALRALGVGAVSTQHGPRPDIRDLDAKMARSLIATDPPDHTALRRLVSRPFTPRAIARFRERLEVICNELVDDLLEAGERGEADLVTQLNIPLPVLAIAELLGIPGERRNDFRRWSEALVGRLDGRAANPELLASIAEMGAYFGEVIAARQAQPRDDLISMIVEGAAANGEPLAMRDLISFCTLLLVAGNETTTNLLGNIYQAFFNNPGEHYKVRRGHPIGLVVEETLRYDTSIQSIVRLTNSDLNVGGCTLPPDALVMILFGSANRDQRRWPDADQFRVDREPLDHLGFGSGIHLCLGAHLARLEATVAVEILTRRVAHIQPRAEPTRVLSCILRGFTAMPVDVVAA